MAISTHLKKAVEQAREEYLSASEDEDTLTGHLGARLQIRDQKVAVIEAQVPGTWTWAIDYYKFRGRGKSATESYLGADGIFNIKLDRGGIVDEKSLLFQAKKGKNIDQKMISQCIKLSTWREAAFVVNYTPEHFEALSLDEVLRLHRQGKSRLKGRDLGEYLGEEFLACRVGDVDLRYDAKSRMLTWYAENTGFVRTKFDIKNRVKIRIKQPMSSSYDHHSSPKDIPNSDIHKYRMNVSPEEILSLPVEYTIQDLKKAKRQLSLAYHNDGRVELDFPDLELLKRRMQEINAAYDYISAEYKRMHNDPK